MSESLSHIVSSLRRAGLAQLADEAQQTLSDPVDKTELKRFCDAHRLSPEVLTERMGGSP